MNATDLKSLAERSHVLEDRTPDRIVELHARIARARRQRRTTGVIATVAAAVVVAAGVVALATGGDDAAPVPAPQPGSVAAPERGDCWAVPSRLATDPDHWSDDSPQVPCSEPHTTETVLSYPLDEPTREAAEEYVDRCGEAVRNYLGVDQASWIGWGWMTVLPSREQIEDGASWLRCDAVFPTTFDFGPARVLTSTVLAVADERPEEFWVCLDQPVDVLQQPLVPCDRPHAYEETGTLAVIAGANEYPDQDVRDEAAQDQCTRAVPDRLPDVAVVAVWEPPRTFDPYQGLVGVCVMFDPTGQPLPAH